MEQHSDSSKPLVTGFQTAAVYVTDLERARSFYVDTLGLEDRGEMAPGRLLGVGEFSLYLEGGRRERQGAGMSMPTVSLCFDASSIRSAFDTLRDAGAPVVEEYREYSPEFAMFRIADPDGNVVEFAGRP
jgi:catechol 2,3-dioxygenase-like lactoylglutathione lyase family enzyme